ncbi:methionine--tRNA ligase, mitochondrial-like [Apostichopus japonicus]|uniref:methionine--tRNA ligase, mitochondrial-like n=1 Tax=Stichopus japonicus TaxID=307972 RepID=UPI003AB24992
MRLLLSLFTPLGKHVHPLKHVGFCRHLSSTAKLQNLNGFCISTPIFYVNAVPHIGHLYSAVLADFAHRYHKLKGASGTIFSTGTDEHGLKIQQAAVAAGKDPQIFCDEVSKEFKRLFDRSDVVYTDFIRTTEARHKKAVKCFWEKLFKSGFIYKGHYEGWYSTSDETFLPESQVTKAVDKQGKEIQVSIDSGNLVEWTTETNYLFKLSEFQDSLSHWLESNPKSIQPSKFYSMVQGWIQGGLKDLSVSRQRSRLEWGIPVPGDDSQTIYVWLDALINYITVCGYPDNISGWPGINIVGKDILKFHAIYWPAFLMAAGLDPPQSIVCHSHWTMDSFKMSKSRGNVVDPFNQLKKFSSDGLRYFLLREGVLHSDGDYSERKVAKVLNVELADTLGNLLSRVTGAALNPHQQFPPFHQEYFPRNGPRGAMSGVSKEDYNLLDALQKLPEVVDDHFSSFHVYKGLDEIMSCLRQANSFTQRHEPWKLAKDEREKDRLETVLHVVMETLRLSGILLQPVTPNLAERLLNRLGIPATQRSFNDLRPFSWQGGHLGEAEGIVFPKVEESLR